MRRSPQIALLLLTFISPGVSHADASTPMTADQADQAGLTPWTVHVRMQRERDVSSNHDGQSSHEKESSDADITGVVYGSKPDYGLISIVVDRQAPQNLIQRSVTGATSVTSSSHEPGNDHQSTGSGTVMPDETTVHFLWRDDGSWQLSAGVSYTLHIDSKFTCGEHPDSPNNCAASDDTTSGMSVGAESTDGRAKLTQRGASFTIDSSYKEGDATVTLHAELRPQQASKYVAVIKPADAKAYAAWIPTGPKIPGGDDAKGGNSIGLVLEVRDRKTGKPVALKYDAMWKITSSNLPGWCMNYPKKADANDKPDLFFDAKQNAGHVIADEGESATQKAVSGKAVATVSSRDYGGYGDVTVQVTTSDGETLSAVREGADGKPTGDEGLHLPLDDNHNDVADAWEKSKDVAVYDRKLPARWDEEDDPPGLFDKGDGYDLYEEYRGYDLGPAAAVAKWAAHGGAAPKAAFVRLSPNRRDLLVVPSGLTKMLLMQGALAYGAAAHVAVWMVTDADLLASLDGDSDATHPRRSSVNRPDGEGADFGRVEAAVWIRDDAAMDGHAMGQTPWLASLGDYGPHTVQGRTLDVAPSTSPEFVQMVRISPTIIRQDVERWTKHLADGKDQDVENWVTRTHATIDRAAIARLAEKQEEALIKELVVFNVMHELGHATGAAHHGLLVYLNTKASDQAGTGDPTCPMHYWHMDADLQPYLDFLAGKWDLTTAPGGKPWRFCDENRPQMRFHEKPSEVWDPGSGPGIDAVPKKK